MASMVSGLVLSAVQFHREALAAAPRIAVFDCDGTLWSGDAGRDFMDWSIGSGLVEASRAEWMQARYRQYCAGEVSELAICGEMAQLYTGTEDAMLRKAAAYFFETQIEARIFSEMERLIAELRAEGCCIWAVSSTNHWVIEEGVRRFGIPPERVLCARVHIEHGRITDQLLDVPTDEGKALALERAGLPHPDAVFGNSVHDAAMLALTRHPFAVNPTPALAEIAARQGWPVFYPEPSAGRVEASEIRSPAAVDSSVDRIRPNDMSPLANDTADPAHRRPPAQH